MMCVTLCDRLFYMDSRAVAAMLKEMARVGCGGRAQEVFDWLRSLPPTHDLAPLCDVFTFTTGRVSLLLQQFEGGTRG